MNELGTDLLVAWLRERRDNAIRIAKTKQGEDQNGWIEDAFYFNEAVKKILPTATGELKSGVQWEYRGEGLYIYWRNPFSEGRKEDVCMFMWPSHAVEDTAKVEALYESMAGAFVAAWNTRTPQADKDSPS